MSVLISSLIWALAVMVFIPTLMFFLEIVASFLPIAKHPGGSTPTTIAVIVPAHNEGAHIKNTLGDIKDQLRAGDRLIVVADNCTDDTAAISEACGAEVIVRHDEDKRGKGYALQFAVDQLRGAPPECVVFLDADCRIKPGGILRLGEVAHTHRRPAQALYLMGPPEEFHPSTNVSVFAWMMMNRVRMGGLFRIANITRFTGAGLAAPWALASKLPFATGDITEDLVLTFKMAEMDAPPLFAPDVVVTSEFPIGGKARVTQRARWEHGSLGVITHHGLPALWRSLKRADFRLLALSLDAMIPPTVLLGGLLFGAAVVSLIAFGLVGVGPLAMITVAGLSYGLSITLGWVAHGREILPLSQISALGPFVLEKLKVYGGEGRSSTKTWTRTDRDDDPV